MNLTEDRFPDKFFINKYHNNQVYINNKPYNMPCLLTPDNLITPWQEAVNQYNKIQLTQQSINKILSHKPTIVIVGTGDAQQFIHPKIIAPLLNQQIGVECMSTQMACQTFNVLLSEGRQIVACLIP